MRLTRRRSWFMVAVALAVLAFLIATMPLVPAPFLSRSGPATRPGLASPSFAVSGQDLTFNAKRLADTDPFAESSRVLVELEAPPGATEMWIGDDLVKPTEDEWQKVSSQVEIELSGSGYQEIYARFRNADRLLAEPMVAGLEIDPTFLAATSSEGSSSHEISWVKVFSPREILVRVEEGRVVVGKPEEGGFKSSILDAVRGHGVIRRNGEVYGLAISQRSDVFRRVDQLLGSKLDPEPLLKKPWRLTRPDGSSIESESVRLHLQPSAGGNNGSGKPLTPRVHDYLISFSEPLFGLFEGDRGAANANRYMLSSGSDELKTYEGDIFVSGSIRANQVGYHPTDGSKLAYLGGFYDGFSETVEVPESFVVLDTAGKTVHTGEVSKSESSDHGGSLDGSELYLLDFSALQKPGRYRVCVSGFGCSLEFSLAENIWANLAAKVARAAFHQRSGIELGPPHTSVQRPRPYHPSDGLDVHASSLSLVDAQRSGVNDFDAIAAGATTEIIPKAWGGHFDAGDWDRRIQHLWFTRSTAQLIDQFPTLTELDLNIPESGDHIPDLLDEGLWSLELYRRMQGKDGSIRGGIEASGHPPANATSWLDDLAVFAYAPDPWSSYLYAGVAAEVAHVLDRYDRERAKEYLASAVAAFGWAETADFKSIDERALAGQRQTAAAALLLATGNGHWHDVFLDSAPEDMQQPALLSCHEHSLCDAAWLYLQADPALTDPTIVRSLNQRFILTADAAIAKAHGNGYRFLTQHPEVPLIWGLGAGGAPHGQALIRAYILTGQQRYRQALLDSMSVVLGANPLSRSFITGVGVHPVAHPMVVDIYNGGLPTWSGIPVYGPHRLGSDEDMWVIEQLLEPAGATPAGRELPYLWQWYDLRDVAFFNEFTLHQSHADALETLATLAATENAELE